jgi:tetratricopeptide (TPR) repeat protein
MSVRIFIILIISISSFGETPARKPKVGESYKSIIAKAQELTLSQDRKSVTKLLVDALENEPRGTKAFKELKKTLTGLSEMFYTEKAQRIYESARSISEVDTAAAIDKYLEALMIEPGNAKILREITRGYLAKGECKKSLDQTKEALLQNPFSTDFFLLRLQSKACLGTIEDFQAELANPFVEKDSVSLYIDLVQAQHMISTEKYVAALDVLEKAKQKDPTFPEIYFWIVKIKTKLNQPAVEEMHKYVSLCKESPIKIRSKYMWEPRTCKELKGLEKQLEAVTTENT